MNLLHLINPVKVAEAHELHTAQPITFESILAAKKNVKFTNLKIELTTTQFAEDLIIIPEFFTKLSNLTQSVNDVNKTLEDRKLPLLKDILQKSLEIKDVDYIIYTNVDIGLMPFFYDAVANYLKSGHDAVVINKRRISSEYKNVSQLTEIYADLGKSHPGFDCFVFKKELLKNFILDNICVGVPFSGVSLLHNILAFAENPKVVFDKHLTFHIGMNVLGFKMNDYFKHNKEVFFNKIYPKLKPKFNLEKFPYAEQPIYKRALNWGLNPSLFTVNYLELESKSKLQRFKLKIDEIRWRILQR